MLQKKGGEIVSWDHRRNLPGYDSTMLPTYKKKAEKKEETIVLKVCTKTGKILIDRREELWGLKSREESPGKKLP